MKLLRRAMGQIREMRMTPRRAELLRFIIREQRATGRPPSRREMARAIGTSLNSVCEMVEKLERHGFVIRPEGRSPRALVVTCWPDGVPHDLTRGRADDLRIDLPERVTLEVAATGYDGKVELARVI